MSREAAAASQGRGAAPVDQVLDETRHARERAGQEARRIGARHLERLCHDAVDLRLDRFRPGDRCFDLFQRRRLAGRDARRHRGPVRIGRHGPGGRRRVFLGRPRTGGNGNGGGTAGQHGTAR